MGKEKDTINGRVRIVRKALGLTQNEFADRIGIKGGSLSTIELGSPVTEQNIKLICTPNQLKGGYTVNEDWIRNGGNAPMFKAPALANGRPKLFDETGDELPQDEEELVGIYRQLTPPNRIVAVKQIDVLLEAQGEATKTEEKGEKGRRADTSKGSG
jgi:transcriptional regulator with XRE-family HTH domain